MNKPIYNVVSCSGGKDSTAMLLRMLEEGMQIDCILFCDTGLEFSQMYEHLAKLEHDIGRPITRIRAKQSYEYLMFDAPIKRRSDSPVVLRYGTKCNGNSWPGPRLRWCTSRLKDAPREQFLRELRQKYDVKEFVGIAADEQYRLERERNKNPNHVHPLADWGMTEADCLQYCYDRGYDWGGLYDHFKRVSCWCCPLQSLEELRQLRKYHSELWSTLKDWDNRTWRKFRSDYSVEQLEKRFDFEDEWLKAGNRLGTKAFYSALKQHLEA